MLRDFQSLAPAQAAGLLGRPGSVSRHGPNPFFFFCSISPVNKICSFAIILVGFSKFLDRSDLPQ
jgi:hypothetical protein